MVLVSPVFKGSVSRGAAGDAPASVLRHPAALAIGVRCYLGAVGIAGHREAGFICDLKKTKKENSPKTSLLSHCYVGALCPISAWVLLRAWLWGWCSSLPGRGAKGCTVLRVPA